MNVRTNFFSLSSMVAMLCQAMPNNKTNRKFAAKRHVRLPLNFRLRLIVSSTPTITPTILSTNKSKFYWFSLCCRGEKPILFFIVIQHRAVHTHAHTVYFGACNNIVRTFFIFSLYSLGRYCSFGFIVKIGAVNRKVYQAKRRRKRKLCQTKWYMEI